MRIGIDGRLWNQTGVGRYIKNICVNLERIDKNNSYVLFVRAQDRKDVESEIKNKNWKIVTSNSRWHSLSEQIKFPRLIKTEKVDLMHFPYFSVPLFYNGAFVVTIHDLILHHFYSGEASTLPLWLYGFKMLNYKIVINNAARKARKVIAVSNSTKEEIIDHLVVNKSNIEVIYEAADDFDSDNDGKIKEKNYFLYVGNVYPHKNVDEMIRAYKELLKTRDVHLVFMGKQDYFYKRLQKSVSKLIEAGKITFVDGATDKELATYYKNSICLVRPSLMEGFSLPPLEAISSNCLVLASDIPVHREIFGESLIYFNPNDFIDIKEKMEYVLTLTRDEKQKVIKKGKELTKKFSWEKAARQTLQVYESSTSLRQNK